eukprot:2904105-Prymnesium_polylepis.1
MDANPDFCASLVLIDRAALSSRHQGFSVGLQALSTHAAAVRHTTAHRHSTKSKTRGRRPKRKRAQGPGRTTAD